MLEVTIYTDGGCRPNPGPGGWAALLLFSDSEKELSGGDPETTNNQMELTAVCESLEALDQPYKIELYTDSQYVKNGITSWIHGWIKRNWKDVKNVDYWKRLHAATQRHDIEWKWVRGHTGVEENERVDQLASAEIKKLHKQLGIADPQGDIQVYTALGKNTWAAVIVSEDGEREMQGTLSKTTVNRLPLTAAIEILTSLDTASTIDYYTDSDYLQRGITQWIHGWIKNGWQTASKKPVKNQDLWEKLHQVNQAYNVKWHTLEDNPYDKLLKELLKET